MKPVKISVNYDRKKVGSRTNAAPVVVEAYFGGKRKYFDTGVRITTEYWDKRKSRVCGTHYDHERLNTTIRACEQRLEEFRFVALGADGRFCLDRLAELYYSAAKSSECKMEDLMEEVLRERERAEKTQKTMQWVIRVVKDYGKLSDLSSLSLMGLMHFDRYLAERGVAPSSSKQVHQLVRRAIQRGIERDLISKDPYTQFRPRRVVSSRVRYLRGEELERLKGLQGLTSGQERARARFLLQVYTGMSVSDLDRAHFDLSLGVVRSSRKKTGVSFTIKLLRPALSLLRQWGGCPSMCYLTYSEHLAALGRLIGLEERLTSHMARHTFATTITLANGVPIEIVSKMLGHTNITMTQRYAKVLAEDVLKEFDRLDALGV